ncbi:hypothetical protein Tco_0145301 [Tanacetum coccineum]
MLNPSKIEVVKNWEAPRTSSEVRFVFLGLAGYYRRFIENFSKIAKSLTVLTQKSKIFDWGEEQERAFQTNGQIISLRFASRPPLRFASRPHCVLLPRAITGGFASQDLTAHLLAFCFQDLTRVFASKLSLRFASTSLRFAQDLHCILLEDHIAGKENGLQILQSIDQGPFELRTTRDALGTTPEGGVLLGPERPRTYEDLSHHMRNIRMTMPNIQLNSKFVNNMSPEWDRSRDRIKCYTCMELDHIQGTCISVKAPQNSIVFLFSMTKMLLMQAQENGAVLDEDELLFLAGEQGNTFDADVDNQPVQDLAPNEDNIF